MGQLATMVRAKYPGAYDHLSDEELEKAVVTKYPGEYDHLVTPPEPKPTLTSALVAGPGGIPNAANTRQVVKDTGGWVKENPGSAGAIVAGVAAAPFTGGMSVPAMMALEGAAAAGGSVAGNVIGKTIQGQELNPLEIGKEAALEGAFSGVTAGIGPAFKALGREAYHTALRPRLSLSHTPEDVARIIDTGLNEGVNVSRGGYQKAGELIGQQADEVRKLIEGLGATGDVRRGLEKIAAFRNRWAKGGMLDQELAAVDDVADQYLRRFEGQMPLEQLHDLKQSIWKRTQNNWDQNLPPVKKEAQMEFGSGLREEIEEVAKARGVDDIGKRNERIGRLMELQETISSPAAHYPAAGVREAASVVAGASPGIVGRAIATSAPVLSTAGRALNRVGTFLDPRSIAPVASHPPIGGKAKTTQTSLDALGIPENAGAPYAKDPLDSLGIPETGGVLDLDEMWLKRTAPEPAISHTPATRSPLHKEPYYGKQTELDELGIPVAEGPVESPVSLDALDIAENRSVRNSEELWAREMLKKEHPELAKLPPREFERYIQEMMRSGGHRSAERNSTPARITKDKVETLFRRYLTSK